MKVLLLLVMTFSISSTFAAKRKDIFGSKLKSKLTRKERGLVPRSLAISFLTEKQCTKLAKENLKRSRKTIKSFTLGSKIRNIDINGEFSPLQDSEDFGHYAKLGLSDDNEYLVTKMNTQFAIHADPRCARYAKVTKVDRTLLKGKSCRRIHVEIGKVDYKTIFCNGDKKGYVDHFDLTGAI